MNQLKPRPAQPFKKSVPPDGPAEWRPSVTRGISSSFTPKQRAYIAVKRPVTKRGALAITGSGFLPKKDSDAFGGMRKRQPYACSEP